MDKFECDRAWTSNEKWDDGNTVKRDDEDISIRLKSLNFIIFKYKF